MSAPSHKPDPLRPSSRALLAAYRKARPMPSAARERVWEAVQEPRRSVAATWLWAGVGAAAAALLLLGLAQLGSSDATRDASDSAMQAPDEAVPQPGSTLIQPEPTPVRSDSRPAKTKPNAAPVEASLQGEPAEPVVSPARAVKPRKRRPAVDVEPAVPAPKVSTLGEENRLISEAWRHVAAKQYGKARQATAEHSQRFSKGVLAPERRAIAVIVDCLTDAPKAGGRAKRFMSAKGGSVLAKKVREACGEKK